MKTLLKLTALTFLTLSTIHAEGMKCGAGKCGSSMKSDTKNNAIFEKMHQVNGYDVGVSSKKALIVGNNKIKIALFKDGKKVDAKVKVKFFMPEMPGMPFMESKGKGKTTNGIYDAKVNLSMGGTWQYHIKFKTADEKVHKIKGSVNL